jgi:hypothetical protein
MAIVEARLQVNLKGLKRLRQDLKSGQGVAQEITKEWEKLYRAFILLRFDVFSRGGGNWPPLKRSTIKKKGHNRILVDTNFMRKKLETGIRIIEQSGTSAVIGFVQDDRHPSANLSVAELATIHDRGLGPPQRKILVAPDLQTIDKSKKAARKLMLAALNRAN